MKTNLSEKTEEFMAKAKPFVKWAGGKRSIINKLKSRLPTQFGGYYEPFVGGGALFFEVAEKLTNAYLSDINIDLMLTYQVIKKEPNRLIEFLSEHARKHNKAYYNDIRSQHYSEDPIEIAARFVYLNKTCYNGLYRVNKANQFNVPIGNYVNPNIIQESNILACNKVFKAAKIQCKEFHKICPQKNDFVYFDPPYHPIDDISFTNYTEFDFTEDDQRELRDFVIDLHEKGVKVMLSNSNTDFIRELYKSKVFIIDVVIAPRYVSCKAKERSPVEDVLITNYNEISRVNDKRI